MKKMLMTMAAAVFSLLAIAQTQVPAFPGAEGHGRYVTGGRGGVVRHVTNLNDSGTGSFRWAVQGTAKKIVVFDVGGVIALNSDVNIGANTTIEGQTAPAPGITLRYYNVNPNGSNIIMRYIRIRRGQERNVNDGADASTARHFTGMMLDHCSFSWSIDETASFYDNNNFTMQWCTIGESLVNAGHGKGAHGYGGIWGGKLASFHHNLLIHHSNRTPRFNGARYNWTGYTSNKLYSEYQWENAVQAENVDFRNCVVYNCGNGCYGGPGGGKINMVNNYYKTGPAATTSRLTQVTVGAEGNASGYPIYWDMTSRYFVDGNKINGNNAGWETFAYDDGTITRNNKRYSKDPNHYNGNDAEYITVNGVDYVCMKLDEAGPMGEVTTHSASTAFNKVLAYAGDSHARDNVDDRYMTEAQNGSAFYKGSVTGKWGRIDVVSDVNGYTEANFGTGSREADFDSDNDGISDAWERANGLNPNDASDAASKTIDPLEWYTNLEVYVNSLVQDIVIEGNADGDDAVKEYFPAYTKEDGTHVEAINMPDQPEEGDEVNYVLSQDTNVGPNTSDSYAFDNNVTITNGNSKNYATGSNSGIKYSADVQYTINLPANVAIEKISFTGYDNYATGDSYIKELAGTTYGETDYVFPQKDASGNAQVKSHTIEFASPVANAITFTPGGKQVVWVITLTGKKGTTGIRTVSNDATVVATEYYDLNGRRLTTPQRGISICVQRLADGSTTATKVIR